jgi:hypothetical protein
VKDAAARVVADLAETMLKDRYIHFDDMPSDSMTMAHPRHDRRRAEREGAPGQRTDRAARGQGHLHVRGLRRPSLDGVYSPVSMYDYSLSRAEEENKQLKARVAQLENRLEEVFP